MKKFVFTLVVAALSPVASYGAAITLNLGAGQLQNALGQPVPDGALVQVVVSTSDAEFSTPTGLSFVGGSTDDVVVASFALNSVFGGGPGMVGQAIQLEYNNTYGGRTIAAGMPMMLRWWPALTASATSPGGSLEVGQFRRDAIADFSEIGWVLPGAPATRGINALTPANGGTTAQSALRAQVIPEPSSAVLAVAGGLAMLVRRRRK
jgi:hypothetical protein